MAEQRGVWVSLLKVEEWISGSLLETFYDCSSVNFDFLVCLPVHSFFLNSSLVSVFMTSVNLVSVFSISCTSFTSHVFSNSLVVLSSSNYVPISLQSMLIYAVFPLLPLYLFGFYHFHVFLLYFCYLLDLFVSTYICPE